MNKVKVNIYGLTETTISFNTIGMMLRGKYNPKKLEPCSFAKNITIENESQANELKQISNLGLIHVETIKDDSNSVVEVDLEKIIGEKIIEEKILEEPKNRSRRNKSKKEEKKVEEKKVEEKKVEEDLLERPPDLEEDSKVFIMTDSGPKSGKMVHKMIGEIDEDDPRCKAAMKAAKELKEEEERVADLIDDSLLDPSERMGSTAIIGTGNGKSETIDMKNSALGNRNEPNFIDLGLDDEVENAFDDDDDYDDDEVEEVEEVEEFDDEDEEEVFEDDEEVVENAFIDDNLEEDNDKLGDAFIEI